jgi:ubiquinone/menaquinone biosynthesis C-methylase UbiE
VTNQESASVIRSDFDRIALLPDGGWNHNNHYHGFLLRQLPQRCEYALDLGCGTGSFSRLLAERCEQVLALDLSPQMIRIARERAKADANVEFQVADASTWAFPAERFDCIVSIATLHHLPLGEVLAKMKGALRTGGTLGVLDLVQPEGVSGLLISALAVPVNLALRLFKTGRLRQPGLVREVWADHGRHDSYLPLAEIRRICVPILPGAQIRNHLLWRCSIVWKKPAG